MCIKCILNLRLYLFLFTAIVPWEGYTMQWEELVSPSLWGCALQTQLKSSVCVCVCVGSVGNCLHTLLAASGANWNASSTCSAIGARSSIADWNANEPRLEDNSRGGKSMRGGGNGCWRKFLVIAVKCSRRLQFASFQMEYEIPASTPPLSLSLTKRTHKENAKAIS